MISHQAVILEYYRRKPTLQNRLGRCSINMATLGLKVLNQRGETVQDGETPLMMAM